MVDLKIFLRNINQNIIHKFRLRCEVDMQQSATSNISYGHQEIEF